MTRAVQLCAAALLATSGNGACTDTAPRALLEADATSTQPDASSPGLAALPDGSDPRAATNTQQPGLTQPPNGETRGTPQLAGTGAANSPPVPTAPRQIEIVGRELRVGGQPLLIRGVCWNPVPIGGTHPEGLDYAGYVEHDADLMRELGVNVVRTYEPLLDTQVLDRLADAGIYVINSVYPWGGSPPDVVVERVRAVRKHPAILMWSVGNEWNYNGLYVGLSHEDAVARLNEAVALIKAEDSEHPVATIYGELPDADTLAALPGVDVWGINAYRGISFGDLFEAWQERSAAPMLSGGKIKPAARASRMSAASHREAGPIPIRSSMKSGGASWISSANRAPPSLRCGTCTLRRWAVDPGRRRQRIPLENCCARSQSCRKSRNPPQPGRPRPLSPVPKCYSVGCFSPDASAVWHWIRPLSAARVRGLFLPGTTP